MKFNININNIVIFFIIFFFVFFISYISFRMQSKKYGKKILSDLDDIYFENKKDKEIYKNIIKDIYINGEYKNNNNSLEDIDSFISFLQQGQK
jgi:hypothetical protein